ncbi:hypothetical protein PCC79_02565 [Propioniciclava soli]|uniref:Uncharacterized protein n=1 Tax=Propioniciclava soli TaxID=2775081 RepID=A0ABZ3C8R8_9ACTN
MTESWLATVPAVALAVAWYWLPGLLVLIAGWRWSLHHVLVAPAVSIGVGAVAATLAPRLGIAWSPLPVLVLAVLIAAIALAVRRWVTGSWFTPGPTSSSPGGASVAGTEADAPAGGAAWWGACVGLLIAAVTLTAHCLTAFVAPGAVSQTFDGIAHLNTIRWIVETADASPFHIGLTSDAPFYPNGWHVVPSLVMSLLGTSVPVAVNATSIAIAAFVWPASCLALSAALLGRRPAVLVAAGALAGAFGAFPLLLLDFGVLYPNALGYALLPAVLGWLVVALRTRGLPPVTREVLGVLLACAGLGLAHPNAFLSLWALASGVVLVHIGARLVARWTLVRSLVAALVVAVLTVLTIQLWSFSRTNEVMSRWPPWQTPAQAFGEGFLVSPAHLPFTYPVLFLLGAGWIALARRPRRAVALWPFCAALALFVLASGFPVESPVREAVTNPWYNDSFRLAALLPAGAIPVATAGAVACWDALAALAVRWPRPGAWPTRVLAVLATAAIALTGQGPNALEGVERARKSYLLTEESPLLSPEEYALLERLDTTTPSDALIAGSPRAGTSLAYALADREVLRKHVFGQPGAEEQYLDAHLRDITADPRVCEVVDDLGVDHVLDFGEQDVHDNYEASQWKGMTDLVPSAHLVLVDAEGPEARLFRIEGC